MQTYYKTGNRYFFNYTTNPLFTTLNENESNISRIIIGNTSLQIFFLNIYPPSSVVFRLTSVSSQNTITQTYTGLTNNQPSITFSGLTSLTSYNLSLVTNYASGNNYPTIYSGNPIITTA